VRERAILFSSLYPHFIDNPSFPREGGVISIIIYARLLGHHPRFKSARYFLKRRGLEDLAEPAECVYGRFGSIFLLAFLAKLPVFLLLSAIISRPGFGRSIVLF
jgi:hypothetical protein